MLFILACIPHFTTFAQITPQRDLDQILQSGVLRVAVRERDGVYYDTGQVQFQHALAIRFADYLGVDIEIVKTPYWKKYWEASNGSIKEDSVYTPAWFTQIDLAADIITAMDSRENKVKIIGFLPEPMTVIGKRETNISSIDDLKKLTGVTIQNTSAAAELQKNGLTKLEYLENPNQILNAVSQGKADYTIWSTAIYELSKYPDLEIKLVLGRPKRMGWACRHNQPKLQQKLSEFLTESLSNGLIDTLFKKQSGVSLTQIENYLTAYQKRFRQGMYPFAYYDVSNGLPQEDILSIFQDTDGYIWFGTYSGAVRYNGRQMEVWNTQRGLHDNAVWSICEDNNKNIYFATSQGVTVANTDTVYTLLPEYAFKQVIADKKQRLWLLSNKGIFLQNNDSLLLMQSIYPKLTNKIFSVASDTSGRYIFAATSQGLFRIGVDGKIPMKRLTRDYCRYVHVDNRNNLWVSMREQVFVYGISSTRNDSLVQQTKFDYDNVNYITQTTDGDIWLLSENTLWQMGSDYQPANSYNRNKGLRNYPMLSFCKDNEGNLWFGLAGGIQKLANRSLRILYPDIIDSYIISLFHDTKNRVWISTNNGTFYFDAELHRFSVAADKPFAPACFASLPNNNILAATTEGLYEIDVRNLTIKKSIKFNRVISQPNKVFMSSRGEIFLLSGRNNSILYAKSFDSEITNIENVHTAMMYCLTEYNGKVLGGNNKGLVQFNGRTFDTLRTMNVAVFNFLHYHDQLWMGTDKGVAIFNEKGIQWIDIQKPDKSVTAMVAVNDGNHLWLGTKKGVGYFNTTTRQVEYVISSRDGLQGNEVTSQGLLIDSDELLWIGTYHGITLYDFRNRPFQLFQPQCRIERMYVNGIISDTTTQKFGYRSNNFVFELSALSFKDERSVEYQFFLEGFENEENSFRGSEYKVRYTNLSSGKYRFWYRARGKDMVWSEYQYYTFDIQQAYWASWWFIALCIVAAVALVYGFIRWRTYRFQQKAAQLQRIVDERTAEVVNQKEKIENAYRNVKMLSEIGQEVTSNLNIEKIINTVYENVHHLMPADVFGIGIYNADSQTLDFNETKEADETLPTIKINVSDMSRLATVCFNNAQEILINNYEVERHTYKAEAHTRKAERQAQSLIYLPLEIKNTVKGIITVQSFDTDSYTDYHLNVLRNISVYTAIALENADAYRQIEAQKQEIQERNADLQNKQEEIIQQTVMLQQANDEITTAKDELEYTLENLKTTQSQLVQSEKMASLGQLIAGVAHEINTPLGAIKSSVSNMSAATTQLIEQLPVLVKMLTDQQLQLFLQMVQTSATTNPHYTSREERTFKREMTEYLSLQNISYADEIADTLADMSIYKDIEPYVELFVHPQWQMLIKTAYNMSAQIKGAANIQLAVDRAGKIVFALRSYARQSKADNKIKARITDGIETVLTLYQNYLKQGIEVVTRFDEQPEIWCYPDELNQVWTNLIHNAIQAMNQKGTLHISVTVENNHVCTQFTDTGKGIPPEVLAHIFEPFFTTKAAGEGTGLGLSIVKKIIEKHEGTIQVESPAGQGATFTVKLPINTSSSKN